MPIQKGSTYEVADLGLAAQGRLKIEWAESRMPVLMAYREEFLRTRPLAGMRVAGCLHVTKETAVLVRTIVAAGAQVAWSGCNPLSTQDDIAAALADEGIPMFAWHGQSVEDFYHCIDRTLEFKPTLTLDDGADLIVRVHTQRTELAPGIIGGTEETTTGVHRLRAMGEAGKLLYPVIAVNDAQTKWEFDNVHGTGQSTLDGIIRATSVLFAGKTVVVAGYGHCGRGCAARARGLGSKIIVTEVDPIQGLKATLEGFQVMPMDEAAKQGDIFITATGMRDVIRERHFRSMKDGAIVCNTGHYDVEINIPELEKLALAAPRTIRDNCEEFLLDGKRRVYLLARGRLVNLAAAEGHPSEVMDMSFANQLLSLVHLAKNGKDMSRKVYDIPAGQDEDIATRKLASVGSTIDKLTAEQIAYRDDYMAGT